MSSTTQTVLAEVMAERQNQNAKWGLQNHDPFKYLAILGEEVGEANKAAVEAYDFKNSEWKRPELYDSLFYGYREELIQVAAVAVAMVESLDRNKPPSFEDINPGRNMGRHG